MPTFQCTVVLIIGSWPRLRNLMLEFKSFFLIHVAQFRITSLFQARDFVLLLSIFAVKVSISQIGIHSVQVFSTFFLDSSRLFVLIEYLMPDLLDGLVFCVYLIDGLGIVGSRTRV